MTFWRHKIRKSFAPKTSREKESRAASKEKEPSPDPCEKDSSASINSSSFRDYFSPLSDIFDSQTFRIFASTWNVGGNSPRTGLNLNDFLPLDDESDIYVLGFQEIVPLNAGNVLVSKDREPAAKWIHLIDQALNRHVDATADSCPGTPSFYQTPAREFRPVRSVLSLFQKPFFNSTRKTFRTDQKRKLKACNCPLDVKRKIYRRTFFSCYHPSVSENDAFQSEDGEEEEEEEESSYVVSEAVPSAKASGSCQRYSCIVSKKMVGIFVTVWAKKALAQHISHLQISSVGCGIMGRLGNKGCISVSMSLHQTSICFICSHLASGEKEGDELRRNSDVMEISKGTTFRRICKSRHRRNPKKILDHDKVIWLGDLNYRIALNYSETKRLLEQNNWDALLENDQMKSSINFFMIPIKGISDV